MKWCHTSTKGNKLQKTGITGGILSGILTGTAYCVPAVWWLCLIALVPLWNSVLYGKKKKWSLFFYAFSLHIIVMAFLYCLIPELGLSNKAGFFLMTIGVFVVAGILAAEYVLVFLPYFLITNSYDWNAKRAIYHLQLHRALSGGVTNGFVYVFFALSYGMAEWLQELFFYPAFPWVRLAAIVTPCPLLLQEAALFGSCFVSIKLVLWNLFVWNILKNVVTREKQVNSNKQRKEWRVLLVGVAFFSGILLFDIKQIQEKVTIEEQVNPYSTEIKQKKDLDKNGNGVKDANKKKISRDLLENSDKKEVENKKEEDITVLLVQGNFSGEEKWDATIQEIKERYLMLSEKYVMEATDFVVWPETALPIDLSNHSMIIEELAQFCEMYETSLFVGAFDRTEDGKYNAIYYVTEQGLSEQIYYKQKLAPFGEYMPFETLLTLFLPEQLQKEAFLAGTKEEAVLFQTKFGKVGTLICFESLFSSLARKMTAEGAELLCIASNDSWFDHSAALYQHHAQAILRAVETGRYVVRVGNSGITSIIAPTGEVLFAAPAKEQSVLTGNVKRLSEQTNYVKYGDWWLVGSYVLLAIVKVFVSFIAVRAE